MKLLLKRLACATSVCLLGLSGQASAVASNFYLEGQDKGSTVWTSQNLQNWQELDYIPVHVRIEGGPVTNQTFVLTFPHLIGTTPGFQNFYNFTNTPNVVFLAPPTLSAPANGNWSYTFTVTVTDGNSAAIGCMARVAAGAHINTGSSLMIGGSPQSLGQLQIHKPAPGPQIPDLAVVKTGPAAVAQGGTITYTLSYTNQALGTNTGMGAQISDILPSGLVIVTNSLSSNASIEGANTIFWDLTNVLSQTGGQVTFQVMVPLATPVGRVITNFSQILSADDDYNPADNTSSWLTTVTNGCTSPVVTNSPVSATNCPGTPVTFSVGASGSSPLSYQWRKDTSPIAGATNSSYTILSVSAADTGSYDVVVTNGCGTATSGTASLTVNANVNVSTAPVSITNCPGTTANFSVSATGTSLSYQWYNGVSLLNGETGSTLTINNVSAANAGTYRVVVSGVCGNAITDSATLTVNANVNVSTAPVSITNCPGTTASFSVSATGTGLSYQWYNGASLLNGETGSTLTINNVSAANAGTYSVVVSGVCGNAITNSTVLVVNQNVSVAPLSGATKNIGDSVTFTAVASGTGPFTYQWSKGLSPLVGQTNSTLTLTNLQPSDAATYGVYVSGACGEAATTSAVLVMNQPPIASITTPTNNSVFVAPATFTVIASASDPDGTVTNVEFFVTTNGVDYISLGSQATGPYSVVVSNLAVGSYSFKVKATDNYGATGESTLVNVSVFSGVPFARSTIHFTTAGYDAISLTVTNPTPYPYTGLRIYVSGVPTNSAVLVNASGTANGEQYIEINAPVQPGVTVFADALLYHVKMGGYVPNPTIRVEVTVPNPDPGGFGGSGPTGTPQAIDKGSYLKNGTFAVQFTTVSNNVYYMEYSSNLTDWNVVLPAIKANTTKTLWIDSGPPATESFPSLNNTRYYRVIHSQ